jgi:hypothetical protein
MNDYSYLPAVKVILQSFVEDMDIDADFEEVYETARINVDDGYEVERSEEVMEICKYLLSKDLVKTFFKEGV